MTAPWVVQAEALLAEGYGVEDIAKRVGVPVDHVRQLVGLMRLSGALSELYRRSNG